MKANLEETVEVPPEVLSIEDSGEAARAIGLRYVTDASPGISRRKAGKGFLYIDAETGKRVRAKDTLERIRSLVIPPAWTDVWICKRDDGHLQATGRDARRRKQHRYHPRWRAFRDQTKYSHLLAFKKALPKIRRRVKADLRKQGMPREKVLALVVKLLEETRIRVGNVEYARDNNSIGLTTMRDKHVAVKKDKLQFSFRGKSGVEHEFDVKSPQLARLVCQCQDLPGQELFQYLDDEGARRPVDSGDVNDYLREIAGEEITAKDFRTWSGTILAAQVLREIGPSKNDTDAKSNVVQAVKEVAEALGNRPATCRKYYIHPAVLAAYLDGSLFTAPRANGKAAAAAESAVVKLMKNATKG